jgi:hypothetical protein
VWDASILASVIDLREIEMQRIRGMGEHMEHHQCGGSSPLGTKMQGLTAGFEHAIQSAGRTTRKNDGNNDSNYNPRPYRCMHHV